MKRTIAFLSITTMVIAGTVFTASASVFSGPVPEDVVESVVSGNLKVTYVGTDAMGVDTYQNRNAEYVEFENVDPNPASTPVSIRGFKVEDAWAHVDEDSSCNSFTVLNGNVDSVLWERGLEAGHSLRVYSGSGIPRVSRFDPTLHLAFMNSRSWCGTNGHYLNNQRDAVYVVDASNGVVASAEYDFRWGYDFKVS